MKRKLIFTAISLCLSLVYSHAQCDFPAAPGTTCPTATAFCNGELDGYCSATYASGAGTNVGMPPFCGSVQNNQWIQFVAGTTTIDLEFTVDNCLNGDGLQAMVLHSDDCTNFTAASNCYSASTSGGGGGTVVFNLVGTNYTVGETYYVMIDGWLGDFCDYAIQVVAGSTSLPALSNPATPSGDAVVCAGASSITYSIPALTNAVGYNWTVPSGATFVESVDGTSITVDYGASALSGNICVDAYNDCHTSGQVCFPVMVQALPPGNDYGEHCAGELFYYPNNGINYSAGTYYITLPGGSYQGCDSLVILEVDENPIKETFLMETLCEGDGYTIGGITYTVTNHNLQIPFSTYENCDSTVYLDLTVLEPEAVIETPQMLGCNNNTVLINAVLSTADTYTWSSANGNIVVGQGTPLITVDAPGTYELTVSQSFAGVTCYASSSVQVSIDNLSPALALSATNVSCNGGANGSATASVSGGQAPFTYTWTGGASGNSLSGLTAGTYSVTVTGGNGCEDIQAITITEPSLVTVAATATSTTCAGEMDGSVTATPDGGTGPYTFAWSSGGMNATETGLTTGLHSVTITDANNCTAQTSIVVDSPSLLIASASSTDANCAGSANGNATVVASGGVGSYTYAWNTIPVQNTATATNLAAGIYTVTVSDLNGCSAISFTSVGEPMAISLSTTKTDPTCSTSTNGSATVIASGGAGGYSYLWSTFPAMTSATATGFSAGTYSVTVTDANNCTATTMVMLNAPSLLTLSTVQQNIACFGEATGAAEVTAMGGTPPYTYLWNDGASQNTAQATGLQATSYSVIVTDANGCNRNISVNLTEPAAPLAASGTSTAATCGASNGTIDLEVTGGTAPYTYAWSGGASNIQDPSNLGPGTYTVVVTDANNCAVNASVTVNTPSGLEALVATTPVDCQGGTNGGVDITVNGGFSPYTFVWSESSNNGNEDFINIGAGSYSVTITDNDGCSVVASGIVTEPNALSAIASASQASCGGNDGSISLLVNGGTTPYTYTWNDATLNGTQSPTGLGAGSYIVTITDANGCSVTASAGVTVPNGPSISLASVDADCNGASTGGLDLTVNGGTAPYTYTWSGSLAAVEDQPALSAGTYSVTVTDANSCSAVTSSVITEPNALSLNINNTAISCSGGNDGTATVSVSGGTAPYTYQWCDGQATDNASSLSVGTCAVTVTDANGCTEEIATTITAPNALIVHSTILAASCFNTNTGSIDLTVSGGTGSYTYLWNNSAATGVNPQNLLAGDYSVTISDDNGCSTTLSNIEITQPDEIILTHTTQEASCNAANGSIDLIATGGTGGYTYNWSNGIPSVSNPGSVTSGTYTVTVVDGNGCSAQSTITVTEPSALSASAIAIDANCFGAAEGSIDVSVSGGQIPYAYTWDLVPSTEEDLTGVLAATYTVTITDANNCTITTSATVNEPLELSLSGTTTDATCGMSNGTIDLSVSGGTMPYSYAWNNGVSAQEDPSSLGAGTYAVTVTDALGCMIMTQIAVNTPNQLQAIVSGTDALCIGDASGNIQLLVSGGMAPFTYAWDGGLPNVASPSNVLAGLYNVVVTDAIGCSVIASIEIEEPEAIVISNLMTEATCGNANGSIDLTVNGGTGPYTFAWDNGSFIEDLNNLNVGSYTVTVTDANNCIATNSINISTPNALILSFSQQDANCNGAADGAIDLNIVGGTGPYTFAWSNLATTEDITNLSAGNYSVEVMDANGCTASIAADIVEPVLLEVFNINPIHINCEGGNSGGINLEVNGGTAPYLFDWNEDALDGAQNPENLAAGTFEVTVSDAQGCTATESVTLTEPDALSLTLVTNAATCNSLDDGGVNLTAVGGTAPYLFDWNNGAYTTEDLSGIPAGNYTVLVTDANGCSANTLAQVDEPAAILVQLAATTDYNGFEISCTGEADGGAMASANGGMEPYAFRWNTGDQGMELTDLEVGVYTLTVSDANGCTEETSIELLAPTPIDANWNVEMPSCRGDRDGKIWINDVIGGQEPFVYSLGGDNFSTQDSFSNLSGSYYTLSIQDANGCEWSDEILVNEPAELVVDLSGDKEVLLGDSIQLEPILNISTFALDTFQWLNRPTMPYEPWIKPIDTEMYQIMVVDENGCIAFDEIMVRVTKERPIYFPNTFSPNDDGLNDHYVFYPGKSVAQIKKFQIFNRWGELMYNQNNFMPRGESDGWDGYFDGKKINPGVLVFFAEVEHVDGRIELFSGDITLIR